jgi:hypothetical protein
MSYVICQQGIDNGKELIYNAFDKYYYQKQENNLW